jgi:flavin-dependent dehydrogenase
MTSPTDVDVVVIGGGPAGTTVASLASRAGLRVLLLERDTFPRYHIGESLAPSARKVLELTGALERVYDAGFQQKHGTRFTWLVDEWLLDWERLGTGIWSWQVDRASYDELNLRNASEQGVEVVEAARARRVIFEGERATGVEWSSGADDELRLTSARMVVDASGRDGLLSVRHLRNRRHHPHLANTATWGYWTGATLRDGAPRGATTSEAAGHGWWWQIPLADGRLSLGYVTPKTSFQDVRPNFESLEAYYLDRLADSPGVAPIVRGAELVSDIRAEQDYSYVADSFTGPGWAISGDAACFLDPLLSTGIHLAQYSGLTLAAAVVSALQGDIPEDEALAFYELTYRRAYSRLMVLTTRLYAAYAGQDNYFEHAEQLLDNSALGPLPVGNLSEIVTGASDLREVQDTSGRVDGAVLMAQAIDAQRTADEVSPENALRAGFSPLRNLELPADEEGGLRLITTPYVRLSRTEPPNAAA